MRTIGSASSRYSDHTLSKPASALSIKGIGISREEIEGELCKRSGFTCRGGNSVSNVLPVSLWVYF